MTGNYSESLHRPSAGIRGALCCGVGPNAFEFDGRPGTRGPRTFPLDAGQHALETCSLPKKHPMEPLVRPTSLRTNSASALETFSMPKKHPMEPLVRPTSLRTNSASAWEICSLPPKSMSSSWGALTAPLPQTFSTHGRIATNSREKLASSLFSEDSTEPKMSFMKEAQNVEDDIDKLIEGLGDEVI